MKWTTEKRYQNYDNWDAATLLQLQAQAANSPYQMHYHIRPQSGLLNDPNGFSYYNGEFHVFYQNFPFGPVHGLKSWFHMTSPDLVHWENKGLALIPDTVYDSHGAYSGSALPLPSGDLFLMYTGNHRDADWIRTPYQLGALMDSKGNVTKLDHPLIMPPDYVSEHFRDPQVIRYNDTYYALLGAQDQETKTGHIVVYKSRDLKQWQDLGYLDFTEQEMGYMIECPNLVFVNDQPVLIFCPQGLDKNIASYDNIYPNMYLIGEDIRLNGPKMTPAQPQPLNLDDGFDVYASQAFNAPDGKAYLISWVGLPDTTYPTDSEGWANCLSQVKELELRDGHLYQHPVVAMGSLRQQGTLLRPERRVNDRQQLLDQSGNQYELRLTLRKNQHGSLHLAASADLSQGLRLDFNTGADASLTLDRGQAGLAVATDYGTTRTITLPAHRDCQLDIFIDGSLCEVFVNDGHNVMTARFFADPSHQTVAFVAEQAIDFTSTYWPLKK